jgi:hypothetical protein
MAWLVPPSTPRCRKDESGIGEIRCKGLQKRGFSPSAGCLSALEAPNRVDGPGRDPMGVAAAKMDALLVEQNQESFQ